MKNKIILPVLIALTTTAMVGCQRQPQSESLSPANPPSAQPNTNSTGSTNLSQANAPTMADLSHTNSPASSNQ